MSTTTFRPLPHVGFEPPAPPAPPASPNRRWWIVAVGGVVTLWAAVGAAIALGLGPFADDTPRPTEPAPAEVAVGGFAERLVTTWLTTAGEGAEDVLSPYVGGTPDLTGVRPGRHYVTHADAVAAVRSTDGWQVTVAAEVLDAVDGGYRPAGTRWFLVAVATADGRLVAPRLPAEVAPLAPSGGTARTTLPEPVPGPLTTVVDRFLGAYLTGGDPSGALASGVSVRALPAGRYTASTIRGMASDASGDVVEVEVAATGRDGGVTVLHYRLRITEEDGGPRVADLTA